MVESENCLHLANPFPVIVPQVPPEGNYPQAQHVSEVGMFPVPHSKHPEMSNLEQSGLVVGSITTHPTSAILIPVKRVN